jgi:hypothetical protein
VPAGSVAHATLPGPEEVSWLGCISPKPGALG